MYIFIPAALMSMTMLVALLVTMLVALLVTMLVALLTMLIVDNWSKIESPITT